MKCEEQKGHPLGKRPFNQDPGEKEEPGMFMPREKHSRHREQREQRFRAGENLVCLSGRKEEAGGRKFGRCGQQAALDSVLGIWEPDAS